MCNNNSKKKHIAEQSQVITHTKGRLEQCEHSENTIYKPAKRIHRHNHKIHNDQLNELKIEQKNRDWQIARQKE